MEQYHHLLNKAKASSDVHSSLPFQDLTRMYLGPTVSFLEGGTSPTVTQVPVRCWFVADYESEPLPIFWLGWMVQLWVAGDKSKNRGTPTYHILTNAEFYEESCIRGPIFAETKGLKVIAHLVWVPKIRVHFWLLNNGYNQFNSLEIKIPQNGCIKSISLFACTIPFIYGTLIWM